eukprot:5330561-Amphidinium_carterae.1
MAERTVELVATVLLNPGRLPGTQHSCTSAPSSCMYYPEVSIAETMPTVSDSCGSVPEGVPTDSHDSQQNVLFWPGAPLAEQHYVLVPCGVYPIQAWAGTMQQAMIAAPMPCQPYTTYNQAACGPLLVGSQDATILPCQGWEDQPDVKRSNDACEHIAQVAAAEAADAWMMEEERSEASSNCSTAPSARP